MSKSLLLSIQVIILIALNTTSIFSQTIKGKILDDTSQPVIYANVVLYTQSDSAMYKVQTTDDLGDFSFEVASDKYYMDVSYIGLADYHVNEIQVDYEDVDLGTLTMNSGGIELETAIVTARRALVEVKPDRTVFNVEGTINSAGDNGLGLLRKAPGVLVDNNNNITVLGRSGVLMYVDGKRLPISGDELTAYLQALPAEQIDKIDIITNPGARYEAEGNAGIIDIRMKKDKSLGFNGSVSLTASQGEIFRGNVSSMLNYRNAKFNSFGTLGYNHGKWLEDYGFDSSQNGFRLLSLSKWVGEQAGENLRFGTDFYVARNHTIGFILTRGSTGGDFVSMNRNRISTDLVTNFGTTLPKQATIPVESIDSILIAEQIGFQDRDRETYNLNYAYNKDDNYVNLDLDYGRFRTVRNSDQPNTYYDNQETEILNYNAYSFITPIEIDIYTAKLDYEKELAGGKLGTGVKYSQVVTDNLFEFYNGIASDAVFNEFSSNQFTYDENVYAAYLSYNRPINEKLSFTSGLRAEQTETNSKLTAFRTELSEPERDSTYLSLFPSLGLSYVVSPRSSFSVNYGRRINRPDYNVLNPFRLQISELGFNIGNPALKPEIVNNYELGYTLDYRYNFKLAYSVTTDQITRLIGTDDSDLKASFINWDNLAKQTVISFNASLPFQVTSKWNAFFNVSTNRTDNQATYPDGNVIDLQAWTYNVFQQHTYNLPKGFNAEVSCWYSGPGIWGGVFKYESSYSINIGLQKKFLQDKLSVKVAFQDLTNQAFWNGYSEFDGLFSYGQGGWDNQRGSISVSYNFGNSEVKAARDRKVGLEDESKRTGDQ